MELFLRIGSPAHLARAGHITPTTVSKLEALFALTLEAVLESPVAEDKF